MADEAENLAKHLKRNFPPGFVFSGWDDIARTALAHIGERGIPFPSDDYMLTQMRDVLYSEGFQIQVDAIEAELASRQPETERDEWREAIEAVLRNDPAFVGGRQPLAPLVEMLLAAIAPLREKLNKEHIADDAYVYLKRLFANLAPQCEPLLTLTGICTQIDNWCAGARQRAEAAEAKIAACEFDFSDEGIAKILRRIEGAMREEKA